MEYGITSIDLERSPNAMLAAADRLLEQEGIRRDKCLDYLCALTDEEGRPAAVGGLFGNTMRCFAVSGEHRGEGLLNLVVTHLIDVQASRGNLHLFLYTKPETAQFFQDLGFHEIARVDGKLVFMENRRNGFPGYLKDLEKTARSGRAAAIVMNANPFTLGHQYLAEQASAACDVLHIFVVSEDLSLVPFPVRSISRAGSGAKCVFGLEHGRIEPCGHGGVDCSAVFTTDKPTGVAMIVVAAIMLITRRRPAAARSGAQGRPSVKRGGR